MKEGNSKPNQINSGKRQGFTHEHPKYNKKVHSKSSNKGLGLDP